MDYKEYVGFKEGADRSPLLSEGGLNYTKKLFAEWYEKDVDPVYTLKDYEHNGLPSAYQVYMHSIDEYDAAMKLVGSMRHWEKLCGTKWFMEEGTVPGHRGLKAWREDMALRDRSHAKALLMAEAEKGSVTAQKTLMEMHGTKVQAAKDRAAKRDTGVDKVASGKLLSIVRDANG